MQELLTSLDPKLIFTAIVLPVATWLLRGMYESWQLRGLYLSLVPYSEQAGSLKWSEDGKLLSFEGFGLTLRILNLTSKLLAVEDVGIHWSVRSHSLKSLRALDDGSPSLALRAEEHPTSEPTYLGTSEPTYLPVVLPANGGTVFLHVEPVLRPFRRRWIVYKEQISSIPQPSRPSNELFYEDLMRGTCMVVMRISGKVRTLPVDVSRVWRESPEYS
jgi:hypothetical protein